MLSEGEGDGEEPFSDLSCSPINSFLVVAYSSTGTILMDPNVHLVSVLSMHVYGLRRRCPMFEASLDMTTADVSLMTWVYSCATSYQAALI